MTYNLTGELKQKQVLMGELNIAQSPQYPIYNGPYEVTPKVTVQELKTEGFRMENNVTVHKVPIYHTSNPHGGNTVYIAPEEI